jgi:hypothetical protein
MPPDNGAPRRNNVWSFGYNRGRSGKQVPAEHSFYTNLESDYTTAQGVRQLEYYLGFESAAPGYAVRPFSINARLNQNYIDMAFRANAVHVGATNYGNDWLTFFSSPTSGVLQLYNNSSISYSGGNRYFIGHSGKDLLGWQDNVGYLMGAMKKASFFEYNDARYTTLELNVGGIGGHTRGLRWNHEAGSWQYQFTKQNGATEWRSMYVPAIGLTSALDACNTATAGLTATVTDAANPNVSFIVSGGGTTVAQVWCNGSNWKVTAI